MYCDLNWVSFLQNYRFCLPLYIHARFDYLAAPFLSVDCLLKIRIVLDAARATKCLASLFLLGTSGQELQNASRINKKSIVSKLSFSKMLSNEVNHLENLTNNNGTCMFLRKYKAAIPGIGLLANIEIGYPESNCNHLNQRFILSSRSAFVIDRKVMICFMIGWFTKKLTNLANAYFFMTTHLPPNCL